MTAETTMNRCEHCGGTGWVTVLYEKIERDWVLWDTVSERGKVVAFARPCACKRQEFWNDGMIEAFKRQRQAAERWSNMCGMALGPETAFQTWLQSLKIYMGGGSGRSQEERQAQYVAWRDRVVEALNVASEMGPARAASYLAGRIGAGKRAALITEEEIETVAEVKEEANVGDGQFVRRE